MTVDRAEFTRRLSEELSRRFDELRERGAVRETRAGFVQATISLDFVVSAKKKPKPDDPEPEPCCVCYRAGGGFICVGECCDDILLPDETQPTVPA